ncbi:MAG: tetratricopeptide repeat protein [Solidesulfovibrio sp.]|uniref:tetratricopeptide repeat protein n=1 Tax=Solidesulfovibrio sp. TaxID=2910990 RepID=UPI002B2051F2|nr:tetratricopeptide repeat protein [Solidesulfovibrio sp.]MEA4857007.1 tetratricopeptide repeat protein [Solidesulfovibrio sp.]
MRFAPRARLFGLMLLACGLCVAAGRIGLAGGIDQAKGGLEALAEGENAKAVTLLTEAIDSNELPEEKLALFYGARGQARAAAGELAAAVDDYTTALEKNSANAAAAYNRGNAHFALRQYDQAISDYSLALEIDVANAKALNNRGAAWFKKGNLQSALANYALAIAVDAEDPDIFLNRGKVYEAMGEPEKAREDFLQVKKLDPSAKTPLD